MVIPVSYWKLTDQEIFEYYQAIAQETTLPIMIYNNPATSGVDMCPELIVRMFNNIANIMMVKAAAIFSACIKFMSYQKVNFRFITAVTL